MVHQWDKTSIEANQSPPWGFRISPPPIAGTFGLINYYGIFLISFITGWCLIILANEGTCVADDFLVLEGSLFCVSIVLWANPYHGLFGVFLILTKLERLANFIDFNIFNGTNFFRGEYVPLKSIFEGQI